MQPQLRRRALDVAGVVEVGLEREDQLLVGAVEQPLQAGAACPPAPTAAARSAAGARADPPSARRAVRVRPPRAGRPARGDRRRPPRPARRPRGPRRRARRPRRPGRCAAPRRAAAAPATAWAPTTHVARPSTSPQSACLTGIPRAEAVERVARGSCRSPRTPPAAAGARSGRPRAPQRRRPRRGRRSPAARGSAPARGGGGRAACRPRTAGSPPRPTPPRGRAGASSSLTAGSSISHRKPSRRPPRRIGMQTRASIPIAGRAGIRAGSVALRMPWPNSASRAASGAARPRMLSVRTASSSPNWML